MAGDETHLAVMLLLLPFLAIFLRATWLELRRRYLYGPSHNKRALFTMDETAPSYRAPETGTPAPRSAGRLPRT